MSWGIEERPKERNLYPEHGGLGRDASTAPEFRFAALRLRSA